MFVAVLLWWLSPSGCVCVYGCVEGWFVEIIRGCVCAGVCVGVLLLRQSVCGCRDGCMDGAMTTTTKVCVCTDVCMDGAMTTTTKVCVSGCVYGWCDEKNEGVCVRMCVWRVR